MATRTTARSRNQSAATRKAQTANANKSGSGFAPGSRPGVITQSGKNLFKDGKLVGSYSDANKASAALAGYTAPGQGGRITNIQGDRQGQTYRQLNRVDKGTQTGQANTAGIRNAVQSRGFVAEVGTDTQGQERVIGAQTPQGVRNIQKSQAREQAKQAEAARQAQTAYVAGQPFSRQAPVLQDKTREEEARTRIAQERGIDLNTASAGQRMLLNEAVNTDVYGTARPKFATGPSVLSAEQKTQEQIIAGKKQPVAKFSIPENLKTGIDQTVVTTKGAQEFTDAQLAEFQTYNQENSDTVTSALDGLLESDPDILAAQQSGDDMQALLEERRAFYEDQYNALQAQIQDIYASKEADYKEQAAQAMGAATVAMASIGAFGVSTASMRYIDDVSRKNEAAIMALASEESAALTEAYSAFMEADFGLAEEMITNAKSTREEIRNIKTQQLQRQQQLMELRQMEREEIGQTLEAIVTSGMTSEDLPSGYLSYLDSKFGYPSGTSASLMDVAAKEKIQADEALAIEQATKLNTLLSSLPVGETVTISGVQYTSRNKGDTNIYTEYDGKGNMNIIRYNQDTGDVLTTTVKGVAPEDGWQFQENNGVGLWVNPNTQEVKVAYDTTQPNQGIPNADALETAFPDGYKPTDAELESMGIDQIMGNESGIQCGQFFRYITGYEGASITSREAKEALIDESIGTEQNPPQAGDGFIQLGVGSYGHIGVVLSSTQLEDGSYQLNIVDANANGDGTVRYRQINSRNVSGFTRQGLKPEFQFGTDTNESLRTFAGVTGGGDETSLAEAIMNGSLTLADVETGGGKRAAVALELDRLRNEALATDDFSSYLQSTAGGKDVSDTFAQGMEKSILVLDQLGELQGTIEGEDTGPILGILRSNNPYDVQAQEIRAQLQAIVPNLARGVYGEVGVLTDADIQNYARTLPNLTQPEDLRNAILSMTLKTVARGVEAKLKNQASAGRDVSGYVDLYNQLQSQADALLSQLSSYPASGTSPEIQAILDTYSDLSEEDIQDALNEWYMNY